MQMIKENLGAWVLAFAVGFALGWFVVAPALGLV
jgi:hypothetical protein